MPERGLARQPLLWHTLSSGFGCTRAARRRRVGTAGSASRRSDHAPERRCIACGRRGPQRSFVRFHVETREAQNWVVPDDSRARTGRGAYLCRQIVCLDQALRKRAFARAFRQTVMTDRERLLRVVTGADGNGKDGR